MELYLDTPVEVAAKLLNKQVDLGLVPVTVIPQLKSHYIISNYCIGTKGAVRSVCLNSAVELGEIQKIYVDYQSQASVALLKVLMTEHWSLDAELVDATPGYEDKISGTTAGLIIGDRAIRLSNRFSHSTDLGEAWYDYTGLAFVFAAWISRQKLPESFVSDFNEALSYGIDHLQQLIEILDAEEFPPDFDISDYFEHNISYDFDEGKREGLRVFLEKVSRLETALKV